MIKFVTKKLVTIALAAFLTLALWLPAQASYFAVALRTETAAIVDGAHVVFLTYDIGGSRFIKLRDLAHSLSGSPKRFDVSWSGADNAIHIETDRPYGAVGSEMSLDGAEAGTARLSNAKTLLDGNEVEILAYTLGGASFYRLRDLGRILDISVEWDGAINAVIIDTGMESAQPADSSGSVVGIGRGVDPSKPMVALTFDDGPSPYTSQILDILEQHGAVATFFVVGNRVGWNSDIISRAYNMGSEIAGHSWSHRLLTNLQESDIRAEIQSTSSAIQSVTGVLPVFFRAPYGAVNNKVLSAAQGLGVPVVSWSVDPQDWMNRNSNTIYTRIMRSVKDKDIILCHDIYPSTVSAMKRVIPDLISRGYQLVTVSELMYYSEKTPEAGGLYNHGR